MKITNLAENSEDFTGNVWLIDDSETVLIDAGEGDCWEQIRQLDDIDKVVVTHSHHDHIGNLEAVVEKFSPEIFAFEPGNLPVAAEKISEEDNLYISGTSFEVIHTPGHKDDSICLYSEDKRILFTGDLIFPEGSFGRTDLAEGDREVLIESIEKITQLDVMKFYPGHDGSVTQEANNYIEKSLENARKRKSKY